MTGAGPLVTVTDLRKHFPVGGGLFSRKRGQLLAVDGVSFQIEQGETLGLVGESGCGKTTVGRTLVRLYQPTSGRIVFHAADGPVDITRLSSAQLKPVRRQMQIIYQDPQSSLNPRMNAGDLIEEPLIVHRIGSRSQRAERVCALLEAVGLTPDHRRRYPHEFSGGQRQRIAIARALVLRPRLVVADEPVSALDVSIQAQVLNLLEDLQREFQLTYLFIAHNLAVVKHISTRIAVMYLGRIVELAPTAELFQRPRHPYTEALMSAIPVPDPDAKLNRIILQGDIPNPSQAPPGCAFHPRCRYAQGICFYEAPACREVSERHLAACHFAEELPLDPLGQS